MHRSRPKCLQPPFVYPIADRTTLGGTILETAVAAMAEAGANWIQVRAKNLCDRELFERVEACCKAAAEFPVSLWVNDRVDVAALLPVAGVHLGQTDLPPRAARRVLGDRRWIGFSTHNESQFRLAASDPDVDVIALGPIYATSSKPDAEPVIGLELLRRARTLTDKPIVAIGGIDHRRLTDVLAAGADSAAVIGAACRGNIVANLESLHQAAGY